MFYIAKDVRVYFFFFFIAYLLSSPIFFAFLIIFHIPQLEDMRFDEVSIDDLLSAPNIVLYNPFYKTAERGELNYFIVLHDPKTKIYYSQMNFLTKKQDFYLRTGSRIGCFFGGHIFNYYDYVNHSGKLLEDRIPKLHGKLAYEDKYYIFEDESKLEDGDKANANPEDQQETGEGETKENK